MLELYNTPHSTCSQKVCICLVEKNLEWTDQQVNLATKEHLSPKYLKINPNGVVLTFIHNGTIITDPSVICEYIDEVFPEPAQKAAMRAWLRFIEEVPTVAVRVCPPSIWPSCRGLKASLKTNFMFRKLILDRSANNFTTAWDWMDLITKILPLLWNRSIIPQNV
jgi:glutathione S-transferase